MKACWRAGRRSPPGTAATSPGASWKGGSFNGRGGGSLALGAQAALRVNAAGQWTKDRLPGTEQFALGGDEFGRGYESGILEDPRTAPTEDMFRWTRSLATCDSEPEQIEIHERNGNAATVAKSNAGGSVDLF